MKVALGARLLEPQRVFCVGRNYAAHAAELDNPIPDSLVVFLKPSQCLVPEGERLEVPTHGDALHHEAEVVLLIAKAGRPATQSEAWDYVSGVSLGLDLTLRDVQQRLKRAGLPWEMAKSFEASAPIGQFVAVSDLADRDRVLFECRVNGQLRQSGDTARMIFSVPELLLELTKVWRLLPGDLVFTGTPAGVGPLRRGDRIEVSSADIGTFGWEVGSRRP